MAFIVFLAGAGAAAFDVAFIAFMTFMAMEMSLRNVWVSEA